MGERQTGNLGPEGKEQLLRLARRSIASRFTGIPVPELVPDGSPRVFREPRATFVTLQRSDARGKPTLRGCIGTMEPVSPLYLSVIRNARQSAFHDPRFDPVEEDELPELRIEISILTPRKPIDAPQRIVPGRDGVHLVLGPASAVFLPQVATEYGWDRTTLLAKLCKKAGLRPDAWKKADLSVFQAIVFGEPDRSG